MGGVLFLITGLLGYGGYLESTLASTYLQGKKVKVDMVKSYNHGIYAPTLPSPAAASYAVAPFKTLETYHLQGEEA